MLETWDKLTEGEGQDGRPEAGEGTVEGGEERPGGGGAEEGGKGAWIEVDPRCAGASESRTTIACVLSLLSLERS